MCRAGIFNFWFYDDQEFELESGRLILRGANGSGKSVTMQSFLPLVLDGDKRPHRLDPFGSRDRRIEYYLLLEADSAHEDRTGYLWMEFVHPEKQLYKTIGIGLRAKRGGSQVGFWGFLLQDGRRVNRDFWLYDRNTWLETGNKHPLQRRALEEQIGSGGQVVQEQAAYREMVNKALFRFQENEAYQDLLQLIVQLRSPKLSKDFKPTAMYEILQQALPPMLDEELSPLSEVLEDMDEIADRLEELQLHRREMEKLQATYEKYNRFMLLQHAGDVLTCKAEVEQTRARHEQEQAGRDTAEEEQRQATRRLEAAEHRLQEVEAELEILGRHEAMEKQRELETCEARLKETEKHLEQAEERMNGHRARLRKLKQDAESAAGTLASLEEQQSGLLDELEQTAREIEFVGHDVYHLQWSRRVPADDRWRDAWRRDLVAHRQALEEAMSTARAEREARRLAQEVEAQLGEIRRERDEAERERTGCERETEREWEALREAIVQWRQKLALLPMSDEALRTALQALSQLTPESRDYAPVREPAAACFESRRQELMRRQAEAAQQRKVAEVERERLEEELKTWRESREPEPLRVPARTKARFRRGELTGAPLYEVCEFRPHVDEATRARLEEVLERSGLLDAWIAPDGRVGTLEADEEEVWIHPDPQAMGYTLADVLAPVPSDRSGLTAQAIEDALRTFRWEEASADLSSSALASAVVSAGGDYRLGPLIGQTTGKARAEYIGAETRRRTRQLMIERLMAEIEACRKLIERWDAELEALKMEESMLQQELQEFPSDAALQQAFERQAKAAYRLEAVLRQEEWIQERLREKTAVWRELQQQLAEQTASWTRLKREAELAEAIAGCGQYERGISDLHSAWGRYVETSAAKVRFEREVEETAELLAQEEEHIDEFRDSRRALQAQVGKLRQLIEELGIADLHAQISGLKAERQQLQLARKEASEKQTQARISLATLQERLRSLTTELEDQSYRLTEALARWRREMELGLVAQWREAYRKEMKDAESFRLCREIQKEYSTAYANRNRDSMTSGLLDEFNAVRHSLNEYVLNAVIDEKTGRVTIVSLRDKSNPEPLWRVLEELTELEAEQRGLLSRKDRELYEEIILRSVGKTIRQKIHRAKEWVKRMNRLMSERNTTSGLRLALEWEPKPAQNEQQLDTEKLVELLMREAHRLDDAEIDQIIAHFRDRIVWAKHNAQQERDSLRKHIYKLLDYREWFQFVLYYRKGEQTSYRELTDSRFNVLSGGEKAMAMYIPLFAATYSRYTDAGPDSPRIISLDEAFAGVDEENMRDMFQLLTDMEFDYMMTSQVLWGCYDTVPNLAIYEIYRPKDTSFVTTFHYRWNGQRRELVD
jgi:uncharacterized protein (TIGR02680 family)